MYQELKSAVWLFDIENSKMLWGNHKALSFWKTRDLAALKNRDFKTNMSEATNQALIEYRDGFFNHKTYQEIWSFVPDGIEVSAFCQLSGFQLEDGRVALMVEAFELQDTFQQQYLSKTIIVATLNSTGQVVSANPSFANEFGSDIRHFNQLFESDRDSTHQLDKIKSRDTFIDDVILKSLLGEQWYRLEVRRSKGANILFQLHNINERKSLEVSLKKQALTDPLTQLLNRRGLTEKLSHLIEIGKQDVNYHFTMLCIDLDGFKMVNDSFGHDMGDKVLVEVTKRLSKYSVSGSVLSRFGGDEFIFCAEYLSTQIDVMSLCSKILGDLSAPFEQVLNSRSILSASIGVVNYPSDGKHINNLVSLADAAMFHAKKLGKNQCVFYQPGMEVSLKRTSDISNRLMAAIKDNTLQVYYQPITDIKHNKIVCFEALLRWFDDDLGYINPEEAVKIAENMGAIDLLEYWVLNRALKDLNEFRYIFDKNICMSVNMSGMHMNQEGAAQKVFTILNAHGLQPTDLTIELTEGVLVDNLQSNTCQAKIMVKQGINLSIDDFGTGYSSLAYLHKMPAGTVKVDRAFVEEAASHSTTLKCIKLISNEFSMQCVIEGIETAEQSKLLESLGYELQQGYYFGRPQPLAYYQN